LEKLLEYDRSSKSDLLGTLSVFIRCNYNTSMTARKLHIHRQSLLYRLEKIEALTEMSLKCHRDLFLLEICTRIFLDY
ncbi:MAG: PucR family transcriptional regulator, partial [Clostridiales bacterium]|nr:PucR family transcriptional regulator [Clostridiales bacterium]